MPRKVKEADADEMLAQLDTLRSELHNTRSANSAVEVRLGELSTQIQVLRQQINMLREGGLPS